MGTKSTECIVLVTQKANMRLNRVRQINRYHGSHFKFFLLMLGPVNNTTHIPHLNRKTLCGETQRQYFTLTQKRMCM